jgi:hypothetical protein
VVAPLSIDRPITWHTAFRDGIQLTFLPYRKVLSFEFEYPLNTEPLRIDAVIIKKRPQAVIDNPLGAIFRKVNIVEYKSPGKSLSIKDFHKTEAYGRLYSSMNPEDIADMTISFVLESRPRKLLNHLKKAYGYGVEELRPGIYHIRGGDFGGMQVIETKRLREEDGGIWLRDLRKGLKREELRGILERGNEIPEGMPLAAYLQVVFRANSAEVEEVAEMPDAFERMLERHGFIAKWKDEGRKEIARKALAEGIPPNTISKITGLDIRAVKKLAGR